VQPELGTYHVAGVSNGGLSAFRIALDHPADFRSVLAVPGYPLPEDEGRLDRLSGHRVWMVVGELDEEWRAAAEQAREELKSLRIDATVTVAAGDGHIVDNYGGADFFDFLDASR
jgi:predicted esterase